MIKWENYDRAKERTGLLIHLVCTIVPAPFPLLWAPWRQPGRLVWERGTCALSRGHTPELLRGLRPGIGLKTFMTERQLFLWNEECVSRCASPVKQVELRFNGDSHGGQKAELKPFSMFHCPTLTIYLFVCRDILIHIYLYINIYKIFIYIYMYKSI